jgi:release factor glutamine methyltransferase
VTHWGALVAGATAVLVASGSPSAEADARWIVSDVGGLTPAELAAASGDPAPARAELHVAELAARRATGEPLQYVLGSWSFRDLDLMVDARVLIPRPETEITAEVAIEELVRLGAHRGRPSPWRVPEHVLRAADLGTGSGAIALALATELSDVDVWATDRSIDALGVARANVAGSGATRVRLVEGDWYEALDPALAGRIEVVVSNPPYVAEHEVEGLPPEVAVHEPHEALVSGPTGLEALEHVVAEAQRWLTADGVVVCELAPHQAGAMRDHARAAGFADVLVRQDLTGRDRVLVARRSRAGTGIG